MLGSDIRFGYGHRVPFLPWEAAGRLDCTIRGLQSHLWSGLAEMKAGDAAALGEQALAGYEALAETYQAVAETLQPSTNALAASLTVKESASAIPFNS